MDFFNQDIRALAMEGEDFRRELATGEYAQLVIMCIQPGEDIGEEVHQVDQVLVFVAGQGEAVLDGQRSPVGPNSLVIVPAGTTHNFVNTGGEPLRLFTIYAPPEEEPGTVHHTRAEAMEAEEH